MGRSAASARLQRPRSRGARPAGDRARSSPGRRGGQTRRLVPLLAAARGAADIVKARDLDLDHLYNPDRWEIYLNKSGDFRDEHGFVIPEVLPAALSSGEWFAFSESRYSTINDGRQFLRFARYFPDLSSAPMDVQMIGLALDGTAQVIDVNNDRPAGTLSVSETDSDGDGVRELRWGPDSPWQPPRFDVLYADIDRDGREDAVVHDTEAHAIEIHLSKTLADSPQPVYVLDQVLEHDRDLEKITIGDFDGDARPDIVAVESGSGGNLVLWRHYNEIASFGPIAAHTDHLIHVRDEGHATPLETIWYRNDGPIRNIGERTDSPSSQMELPSEGSGCTAFAYPTVCMKRGMPVVVQHQIAAPRPVAA
ncbi:hypothetical protein [Sorangium sp. So ce1024]|uniref:hypothetical protein n=1 Tax=Sorangium sp. So ce1024 TaxID=3133327 RepID=UPI003F059F14